MTSPHLVQPTTAQDAIDLMLSAPLAFDSPTNHRLRDRHMLERAFDAGRRRPEWVWALRDGHHVLACVAGMAIGEAMVLDHFGGDPIHVDLALAAASRAARELRGSELCLHLSTRTEAEPSLTPWLEKITTHGWKLLVSRHHYETNPAMLLGCEEPTSLRLEQLTGPEDARLVPLFRAILDNSLDAHDKELVARLGLEDAARQSVDDLRDADPWQCIRLAFDATSQPVGIVSWVALPSGRGFVNHIGVTSSARGRGYGRQLLALATRALITEGVVTLVADTDAGNHPMVAAFDRLGWTTLETRMDFLPI